MFLAIHLAALVIGASFARRCFAAGAGDFGSAFTLYALAELSYLTYHLDWDNVLVMKPGDSARFTFTSPGLHRYDCSFHPHDVRGTVLVAPDSTRLRSVPLRA